ncbi:MAG TPA: EamA family transporter [Roseiflexaceae bacterium]|nr:EamA family transporter [Roseiflexaceae bacterium]
MHWIPVALLAPACWAVGNHIDKYLLARQLDSRGIGSLMICSALVGALVMPLILIVQPEVLRISLAHAALIMLNGMLYVLGLLPYFHALQRDEASIVVPLFQTSAVFSYILGLLVLGEDLTALQLGAALLIICGSILIALELGQRRSTFKSVVFALMLLASFLNALNWLLFKFVAVQEHFWVASFWEYAGFVLVGALMLLFVGPYRRDFVALLKQSKFNVLGLVALNETASLAAKTATNVASLMAPLALVSTVNGLQPLFVLMYAVMLTLYLPRYGRERLGTKFVIQKVAAMTLMIVGASLLAVG